MPKSEEDEKKAQEEETKGELPRPATTSSQPVVASESERQTSGAAAAAQGENGHKEQLLAPREELKVTSQRHSQASRSSRKRPAAELKQKQKELASS